MYTLAWLVALVVFLAIELITMGLTTIWFAGGSIVALLLAIVGVGLPIQIIMFLVVSVILFVFTRPLAMKYFNQDRMRTNADRLIGQTAVVLEEIDTIHSKGLVRVEGQDWSAKTLDTSKVIPVGRVVCVEEIQGVKLVVKEQEEMKC